MKILQATKRELLNSLGNLPQTAKMEHFIKRTGQILDDAVSKKIYVTYEDLSEELELNNPRHKSMSLALFNIAARNILSDQPIKTSIVISRSLKPGSGYFGILDQLGIHKVQYRSYWSCQLLELGYQTFPDGSMLEHFKDSLSTDFLTSSSPHFSDETGDFALHSFPLKQDTIQEIRRIASSNRADEIQVLRSLVEIGLAAYQQTQKMFHPKPRQD